MIEAENHDFEVENKQNVKNKFNKMANLINEAASSLQLASKLLEKHKYPLAWGILQNRLGLIFYNQGLEKGEPNLLRDSISYFKSALQIYTQQKMPARWVEIMSNFAHAVQVFGEHTQSLEALATSVNAFNAILESRNRKKTPLAWAATQNNLGSALFLLSKRTRSINRLRSARTAFKLCLEVYKEQGKETLTSVISKNLKRTSNLLTHLEWENSITDEIPKDPSGLPEPGEGLIKKSTYRKSLPLRLAG